ncbi:MAG: phosphate acyltransferase PlsX [Eggerthellaceae bacterium]|nr:phosphate acyltransferase PlsX [Eggerthellaceae bacterium]
MSERVVIAVDAMGGDFAPDVVLNGCALALESNKDLEIALCGPSDIVEPFSSAHERCIAYPASEVIAMGEHPAHAVRRKKDSSIVVGCRLVKEGEAHGFFSAGSTGACLAAATLVIGRCKGISRPMLATIVPSPSGDVLLCDVGANADCKPAYLVQFAQMAVTYAQAIMHIEDPRVALLNIGSEDAKGSSFAQECFAALKEAIPQFVGNAEPGDVLSAKYDVFVTDGWTGNICLKTVEGTAKTLFKAVKSAMLASTKGKIGGLLLKDDLKKLAASLSADTHGGAPLLGVNGACIVGHGSSNETAIKNGILATASLVSNEVVATIAASAARMKAEADGKAKA